MSGRRPAGRGAARAVAALAALAAMAVLAGCHTSQPPSGRGAGSTTGPTISPPSRTPPSSGGTVRGRPAPIYGVTVDDVSDVDTLVNELAAQPVRPTTRIYFDVTEPVSTYVDAARRIHAVSQVMGELLDSSDEKAITVDAFRTRAETFLDALAPYVDIWEVGNELNGNWLGSYQSVSAKLVEAYRAVTARRFRSALTLYANDFGPDHCGDGPAELTPAEFTRQYVPAGLAAGVDYVLLSYYPSNCGNLEPSSAQVAAYLAVLHALYPRALLGFGETGLENPVTGKDLKQARQVMAWAYSLRPGLPYYVGGYFWWYGAEDMLTPAGLLKADLAGAFRLEAASLG